MKALHLWFLVATTLIAASVTMADTADISGLAYYAGNVIDDRDGQCYPITGATVNLYKRTANNGWQQFGDAITTTSDGYYLFSDIAIDDPYGLFENADWCMILVNAEGCIDQWTGATRLIRYVNKEPRDGVLRVDYIFYEWFHQTPPTVCEYLIEEQGHAAVDDGYGHAFSIPNSFPDPYDPEPHLATCPIGQNEIDFKSCIGGHWTIYDYELPDWGNVSPGYARYEFYGYTEDTPPETFKIGEGFYYWDNDWPAWAMHQENGSSVVYIAIDFVDMPFPPSQERRQAKSNKPVATKPVIANLYPVAPNPSRGSASISFELTQPSAVSLIVYDMAGRKVSILVDGQVGAGRHDVAVTDLVPGVYTYCLKIPGYTVAKKMVVTR